ncbi:MAG: hypothetical protein K9J16_08935 [Melioribacteraceae bacterium]|nr:hypothetical protein [Melioribacteraceae bacterium]MCF8353956.1 hypothetical protein [Melioribacteraceae bacterium]MCF8393684.1 hypothetical protein [Melioribacteraceae bacterium]MCF8419574.1 hypothetical protein [Melioribacteraceae bacterium]
MSKIEDVLKTDKKGLHYGNRLILPFPIDILKVNIKNDIITDFSTSDVGAEYIVRDDYTEIYFHDYKSLMETVAKYAVIKMVVVEKGTDIFDQGNHKILSIDILDKHIVDIKEIHDDQIFIE